MIQEFRSMFDSIELIPVVIAICGTIWLLQFLIKVLFPNISALNDILSNLKHVEDIPKMKEDIKNMKEDIASMESKLTELVNSNILARGDIE